MNFLIDAQLPRRLARRLQEAGYDAIHTLDLPLGNRTTDAEIVAIAAHDQRVVITKDADFVSSFVVIHQPAKLLLISTGNIDNATLEALFMTNLAAIVIALTTHNFIELNRTTLIVHV